ncbi:probable DNA double-strand break repair Rad50 ATPase [Clytia hemisphaerica]|uniref:Uncharacterized protein n=1 Tax=Clytia hemisphaerica TaxID=252671 RepID=A0A7M5V7C3_9CNID
MGKKNLDEAEKSLEDALKECSNNNVGYKAVIYADLIHLKNKRKENSDDLIKQYKDLLKNFIPKEPEELAMKGYAATLFHCYEDAIKFYKKLLSMVDNPECEWVFGLALAMQHRQVRRKITERNEDIEKNLRKAIELDPSYDMARIKLAKELWTYDEETKAKKRSEIENLIDEVLKKTDNPLTIRIAAVTLLNQIDNSKGEKALKKLPESREVLRALGSLYFKRFKKNTLEFNLNEAIKCFDKIQRDAMPFDLTKLGYFHLEASWYYDREYDKAEQSKKHKQSKQSKKHKQSKQSKKHKQSKQSKKHNQNCKTIMEKAENRLIKDEYDLRNNIETCYRLSQFYRHHQSNSEKEFRYLEDTLQKANEGSNEENLFELEVVIEAKERLLEIANGYENHVEKFKLTSYVYEQSGEYDIALNRWREAMSTVSTGGNETPKDMLEKEAILLFKVVDKEMKSNIDCPTLKEFDEKVKALNDCKTKDNLQHEVRLIKIEKLMTNDKNLEELKEKLLQLEGISFKKERVEGELNERVCEVIIWLCTVLDRSVMLIENTLYQGKGKASYNLQFPRPNSKDYKYENGCDEEKLKKFFEKKCEWDKFSNNYKELFEFFFERLNITQYAFLTDIFNIRKKTVHHVHTDMITALNDARSTEKDKIQLARDASKYAAENWNFILQRTVDVDKKLPQTPEINVGFINEILLVK